MQQEENFPALEFVKYNSRVMVWSGREKIFHPENKSHFSVPNTICYAGLREQCGFFYPVMWLTFINPSH